MYSIRLELEQDEATGVYTVTSPDVPGLVTEGATPDEITHNVQEVLEGLFEVWAELGMSVPPALQQAQAKQPKLVNVLVTA